MLEYGAIPRRREAQMAQFRIDVMTSYAVAADNYAEAEVIGKALCGKITQAQTNSMSEIWDITDLDDEQSQG